MSTKDPLFDRVQKDEQSHNDAAVRKDLLAILHRETAIADRPEREKQTARDMAVVRDYGVSDKQLKDLGFPDTDHMVKVMTDIGDNQKQATRKDLPDVKLDAKEQFVVGSMERAIATGDVSRLDDIADAYRDNAAEFQKLAKVVGVDMKRLGIDVSTYQAQDVGPQDVSTYTGMEIRVKSKGGGSISYGVSTSDSGNDARVTTGKGVISSADARTSLGLQLREQIALQASHQI